VSPILIHECAALLYKTASIKNMRDDSLETMSDSQEIYLRKKYIFDNLLDAFLRLFAPLM